MKILITGATGFIGGQVLRTLQERGHEIVACVRNPNQAAMTLHEVEIQQVDFARDITLDAWLPRLQDIDVVINAVGIIREMAGQSFDDLHCHAPIALFQACAQVNVKRVIQISALGADDKAETAYHLSKRAADEALMQMDINWLVLRPSIVYGAGASSFALFRAMAALPLVVLPAGGQALLQPIYIDDLTKAVTQCVEGTVPSKQIINFVGKEPLHLRTFLEKLRRWQGLGPLHVLNLPYSLFFPLAASGEILTTMPLSRDSLRMLRRGNHADATPFIETFGFTPRSIDTALPPATQAERWHARLYFLPPLLLFSIVFTWLSAGLTSAFFYSTDESYNLLQALHIPDALAPLLLYGAAGLDCALGLAMLSKPWLRWAVWGQIGVMFTYTLLISVFLPEYWLHPFGPVVKNVPLLVASLVLLAMEEL